MNRNSTLLISIFIVSLSLRFVLCWYNREANDNHLAVVEWIINKHELPVKNDCWECFQPKLFYLINAAIISALNIEVLYDRILCMQLLNFVFGFFTLLFLWKFINHQAYSEQIKITAFALLAFNPCLIGINAQATNDSLAILTGVLTIYYADRFFTIGKISFAVWLGVFVILASLVKGTGLVLIVAVSLIFLFSMIGTDKKERKRFAGIYAVIILGYLALVPIGAGYVQNYKLYGTPFALVIKKDAPPDFFNRSFVSRPGITSVADGYFTFRYFDMIRQPYIENDAAPFSLHRTSLWSQLYGRTMFMHFDQFPEGWKSKEPEIIWVGRLLIILGIVPLLLFVLGMLKCCRNFLAEKRFKTQQLHLVFAGGFLLFMIKYTYDYRDFSFMKSLFIFPALPSFILLFMEGFSQLKSKILDTIILTVISIIVLLSMFDVWFLIKQLSY